jgi:hypothetical protein
VFRRLVIYCASNDVLDVKRAAARKCLMFEADGVADRLGGREDLVNRVVHKAGVRNAPLYYLPTYLNLDVVRCTPAPRSVGLPFCIVSCDLERTTSAGDLCNAIDSD